MRRFLEHTGRLNSKGFTLVEVLIAMAISGIVMGAIYGIFISSNRSYRTQDSTADAQQRVRVGIDFMAHDLRMVGMDPLSAGAGFENATATQMRLTADRDLDGQIDRDTSGLAADLNQERITYAWDGQALRRRLYEGTADETAWQTVIEGVSALNFNYLNAAGAAIAAPVAAASLPDIRMVDITMSCQGTDAKGQPITRTLTTRVICRNRYM